MFDAAAASSRRKDRRPVARIAFDRLLGGLQVDGSFVARYPDGTGTRIVGGPGPALTVEFRDWKTVRRMVTHVGLALGEAFMDGTLVPVNCSIHDVLDMMITARRRGAAAPFLTFREALGRLSKRVSQFNPASRSRRNVAHHYDLNGTLYALLLDKDLQYSCAYFRRGDETLDEAQAAKKRHIASKLLLTRPGLRVLDIGCGWGGMALMLAQDYGADVTGITLSQEQLETARARAEQAGLAHRVRFELLDYRAVRQRFDRIVSIGMFEHVGINHYRTFFRAVRNCLEPDGVAMIHAIGRSHGPNATNPWMQKYIFPGGYSPALSEVMPAVEKSGLIMTDLEVLRMHYARTLECWRANFERNRQTITDLYDERFARMFELYLSGAEVAFRRTGHMVWQMQLAGQPSAVPLTRDYITE